MTLRRDLPPDVLAARVRAGELVRVRHGVYGAPPPESPTWERRIHELLARAAGVDAVRTAAHWFSHTTAAVLWGCAVARIPRIVDVTGLSHSQVKRSREPDVRRHWTSRAGREREVCHDLPLPVSSLERTVVDCARTLPTAHGLVVADSALRLGADLEVIDRMVQDGQGDRGIRAARVVAALADGRSESAGESLLRYAVVSGGLPAPVPQLAIRTELGWRWADLGWPEQRVVAEFDGRGKYGATSDDVVRAFTDERRRQQAIEDEGWRVLRFAWSDLRRPEDVAARVARALRSGSLRDVSLPPR